ncbi:hypothetical protein [Methylomonas sp. LWB]|uniref:hypothetical protein n=1 Tax=Methylomonas sp. LWB TaxID=1905845 RepID=UPI0011152952|nr:hypothetical protein [Methylomonas sp. LWB]
MRQSCFNPAIKRTHCNGLGREIGSRFPALANPIVKPFEDGSGASQDAGVVSAQPAPNADEKRKP